MKDSDNKTILLAVCALGAFWIMSRRSAVAGTVAARPATSTSSVSRITSSGRAGTHLDN